MPNDVGIRMGVDGEKEYSAAIRGINSQIKNLSSEMQAAVSSMAGMDDAEERTAKQTDILGRSIEAAKKKIGLLSGEYDRQKQKLDQLGKALDDAMASEEGSAAERERAIAKATNAYNAQAKKVTDLGTEINKATAEMNRMERELEDISRSGKEAESALSRLERTISDQENAVAQAKREYAEAALQYGKNSREAKDLAKQLQKMSKELSDSKSEFQKATGAADKFDRALDDAESGANDLGNALAGGAVAGAVESLISGISGIVEETKEYRKVMGTLDTSSQKAGYTTDQTSQSFRQLYGVLGDEQQSATALANLQALGLSQQQLAKLTDGTIGAWATYGDSIPIDGLAESINETIRAGSVTGTFADVLNWGSKEGERFGVALKENTEANKEWNEAVESAVSAEDFFNLALQDAGSKGERLNLVMEALSSQGLNETAEAWRENNENLVESNEAQLAMNEALADTAEVLQPVSTLLTEGFAKGLEAIQPGLQFLMDNGPVVIGALAGIGAGIAAMNISGIVGLLSSAGTAIAGAIAVIGGPATLVVAAITGIIGAVVALWNTNEGFRTAVINAWEEISEGLSWLGETAGIVFGAFASYLWELPGVILDALGEGLAGMIEWGGNMYESAKKAGQDVLDTITEAVTSIPEKVEQWLDQTLSNLLQWGSEMVSSAKGKMTEVVSAIQNVLEQLPSKMVSIGRNIVQGIWEGISNTANWLMNMIGGWANSIISGIEQLFGINSPSRVMRDEVGLMLAKGMAEGIQKGEKEVLDTADRLNEALLREEESLTQKLKETGLDEATKTALENQLNVVKEFRSEYEKALEEVQKSQDSMAQKLKEYGDLFTMVKEETGEFLELGDLQKDIDAITRYGDALEQLKGRGVSGSLLDEIVGMDVDDATAYTERLLSMTDEQYAEYMELWEKKQEEAQKIAMQFYQDEMDALKSEFVDKIPEELSGVKEEMRTIGTQGIQGLIDGMWAKSGELWAAASSIVAQAIASMRAAADINSPSKETARLVGEPMGQGIAVGMLEAMQKTRNEIAAAVMSPVQSIRREDMYNAAAATVNGMAATGWQSAQTVIIPVQLNGKQIAEVVYDPLRQVARQRGVAYG